jgi:hypothetical protein
MKSRNLVCCTVKKFVFCSCVKFYCTEKYAYHKIQKDLDNFHFQKGYRLTQVTTWGARIVQWHSAGLPAAWLVVRVPAGAENFSLHHRVQTASGSHPASCPTGTGKGAVSLGVKWLGCEADHSHLSSAEFKEIVELYLHSPNTPSWRGARLKKSTGTNLLLLYL